MSNAMTYKVLSGTYYDVYKMYKYKMAALFALKFAVKDGEMWMASDAVDIDGFDGVDALNDIVIHQAGDTYLLRLKHRHNNKKISEQELLFPRGDFDLEKYFKGIRELKWNLNTNSESQFQKDLGEFSAIHFVIFTNRSISQCEFLEESVNTKVNFLNCKPDGKVHRINADELGFAMNDRKNYSKVFVISNQMDEERLDGLILQEMKNVLKYYQLIDDDVEKAAETFTNFILNWAEGYDEGFSHDILTKSEILQKLSEIMLSKYEATFTNSSFLPDMDPNQLIWNNIVESKKFTVTKYSKAVFDFLLKYFAYEVNKHCALGDTISWSVDLPDHLRKSFYEKCDELKTQKTEIAKYLDVLKPVDIYKYLWTITKIPVLLEVATTRHFNDVQQILQMSNNYYKVLILNKCDENYKSESVWKNQKSSSFFSLEDVNGTARDSILRINVSLQGRGPIALGSLITENMFRYITCENIISTLTDHFNIGNKPTRLIDYFIERKVSKIFIKSQALHEVKCDKFVVGGNCEENVNSTLIAKNVFKRRAYDASSAQNRIKIGSEMDSIGKRMDKPAFPSSHHLAAYSENLFEWKCSIGSVSNIKPFVVELEDVTESDIVSKLSSNVTLLSGAPGTGKSVLLDYLAHRIPANRWVIKVDLNAHMDYFKKFKVNQINNHLKYFHDFYKSQCNKNLSDAIFNKLRSSRDVVVMLDGFDEISLQYKEEVVDIVISLCNEGCRVCITTRPHMREYLEDRLGIFSIPLKSFSENDQIDFLRKYFSGTSNLDFESQQRISQFVENLLQVTKRNLVDLDAEFTGIPLQTYLLAEVFQDDCPNEFNQTFDLIYLFRSFINKKMEILASKNGYSIEKAHFHYQKPHAVLALKLLFPSHCDVIEYVEKQPGYSLLNEVLQEGGIVTIDKHSNINFIHRTFGEYLAAQWLSENFNSQDEEIKKIAKLLIEQRFDQNHKFLFILFDRILAKDCPLLLDIINNKMTRVIATLNLNIETVLVTDRCKRSVLHMLALYGTSYPRLYRGLVQTVRAKELLSSCTFEAEKTLDIVTDTFRRIPNAAPNLDQLGYSPLDYALANRCLGIADKLCNFWKQLALQAHIRMDVITDHLVCCTLHNLKRLFNKLLVHFVYRNLLLNNANMEEKVEHYYQRTFSLYEHSYDIYKYSADFKNKTIRQFVLEEGSQIIPSLQNLDTDIHMAIIFGPTENERLLYGRRHDIDKGDGVYNNTLLHYAILHNKTDLINLILSTTSKGAQMNAQNNNGDTPLHLALRNRKQFLAKVLIDEGADLGIINKLGESCLHIAASYGCVDALAYLRSLKMDANSQTNFKQTPLILAVENNHCRIVRMLLSYGAKVNTQDSNGKTCLHIAVSNGAKDIVNELISWPRIDIDIDIRDASGCTPLRHAVGMNNHDIVQLLISGCATIYMPDYDNESCLHLAARMGYSRVMHRLLPSHKLFCKAYIIDLQDEYGNTALHYATEMNHLEIVNLLLAKSADVNLQNQDGENCLHKAVFSKSLSIVNAILSRRVVRSVNFPHPSALNTKREISMESICDAKSCFVNIDALDNRGKTPFDYAEGEIYYLLKNRLCPSV